MKLTPMNGLRWLSVAPAAILGWYAALMLGLVAHSGAQRLCPTEEMISGLCVARWYPYAERAIMLLAVALSAFLVVVCASLAAPSHRVRVAWAAYAAGVIAAADFLMETGAAAEFTAAMVAGWLSVLCVSRFAAESPRHE